MQRKIITTRVSEDIYNEVKRIAEKEHRSMSSQIALMVEEWIKNKKRTIVPLIEQGSSDSTVSDSFPDEWDVWVE